ncbi:mediator of RNA polymerase II transcription subunit 6-like [Littorina saxatilis]|uniref:Mediator of RNA polymerase II transcription subunit 6 n=1 Tax=Littorina saxatilis TaxID=31220 RepID=A0AAN9BE75_9CAEN
MEKPENNTLGISWHDSQWIPLLNQNNILDYFSERSNPFYDRTCNNEVIKMQRLSIDQLVNMTGLEFTLLHAQEPILYVIRKQNRHSPTQVTPLADYYIIGGIVYQGPDLGSVINSRMLNTLFHLQSAFDKTLSNSKYHPSKGYWWEFKDNEEKEKEEQKKKKEKKKKKKEEPSSMFQRQRVDLLLGELAKKYPPQFVPPPQPEVKVEEHKVEPKVEKVEKTEDKSGGNMKPPPEKKAKLR